MFNILKFYILHSLLNKNDFLDFFLTECLTFKIDSCVEVIAQMMLIVSFSPTKALVRSENERQTFSFIHICITLSINIEMLP